MILIFNLRAYDEDMLNDLQKKVLQCNRVDNVAENVCMYVGMWKYEEFSNN